MDLKLKLYNPFVAALNKNKEKYGESFERMNGFHNSNLNFTDFIDHFIDSKNVADSSIDANANSSTHDIRTLLSDMMKPHTKLLSYNKIFYEITKKYGLAQAEKWLEGDWNGETYLHDGPSASLFSYCFAYDLQDVAEKGLFFINKLKAKPAKHLTTYNDHVLEFVSWTANRTSGAVGLPSYLIYSYYFWQKDVKDEFYLKNPEYYRRQCFQKFLYDLNQPYLRIVECVTEDTEVLTPNGFKGYDQLKVGDDIYTWKDGKMNIQQVDHVTVKEHDGDIHIYEGRDVKQAVTPNHRVLYKKFNTKDKYDIKYSSELINQKTPLDIPIAFLENDQIDYEISDELLELLIIILNDGHITSLNDPCRQSRILITKSIKRYGIDRIRQLFNILNLKYTEIPRETNWKGTGNKESISNIIDFYICSDDSQNILKLINYTKKELPEWLTKISRRQANLIIDTWSKFDGCTLTKRYNQQRCQCDNYKIADQLQHICVLAGRGSRLFTKKIKNNKKETIYVQPYSKNKVVKSASKKRIEYYKGKVWCPTTKDGIVVFRKEGKIFISGNCAFSNVTIMDREYLTELFGGRLFPDGEPIIDHIEEIIEHQKIFMEVVAETRKKNMFTFPVLTYSLLYQDGKFVDEEFARWCNKHNMQWYDANFYVGNDVTSLSNCCRLISQTDKLDGFINSIGGTALSIGSVKVNTINLRRIALESWSEDTEVMEEKYIEKLKDRINTTVLTLDIVRSIIKRNIEKGILPNYSYGLIDLAKQYNTIGITAVYEALDEFGYINTDKLGNKSYSPKGLEFAKKILNIINEEKEKYDFDYSINVEAIPAERANVVLCNKDNQLYRNANQHFIYSNQWIPLMEKCTIGEKIKLGSLLDKECGGGQISHINLEGSFASEEQSWKMLNHIAAEGVVYFAYNNKISVCEDEHGFFGDVCPECGKPKSDTYSRIVGFLVPTSAYSKERKQEFDNRKWFSIEEDL